MGCFSLSETDGSSKYRTLEVHGVCQLPANAQIDLLHAAGSITLHLLSPICLRIILFPQPLGRKLGHVHNLNYYYVPFRQDNSPG